MSVSAAFRERQLDCSSIYRRSLSGGGDWGGEEWEWGGKRVVGGGKRVVGGLRVGPAVAVCIPARL